MLLPPLLLFQLCIGVIRREDQLLGHLKAAVPKPEATTLQEVTMLDYRMEVLPYLDVRRHPQGR
jgi:hypothetical protein